MSTLPVFLTGASFLQMKEDIGLTATSLGAITAAFFLRSCETGSRDPFSALRPRAICARSCYPTRRAIDAPRTITIRQGEDMGRPSVLHVDIPAGGGIVVAGAVVDL